MSAETISDASSWLALRVLREVSAISRSTCGRNRGTNSSPKFRKSCCNNGMNGHFIADRLIVHKFEHGYCKGKPRPVLGEHREEKIE